ncbi:MAG TPA: DUF1996 domain-containing protein [Actinomycetota bacterium]|nr:DUF1996 domain-containing protein [Actinomycetota bacterium]
MIRRRAIALLPLVATLVAGFVSAPPAQALLDHTFRIQCAYSHAAMDDPIVFPKQPGASHLHTFFGNTSTNAFSTYRTLRAGTTTCQETADASGYWVPALYQDGKLIVPSNVAAYYRAAAKVPSSIHAFPAGLEMVAGDAHATAPQASWITRWQCLGAYVPYGSGPPYCIGTLSMLIFFPDCWDGRRVDSPDHKAHMAYAEPPDAGSDRTCPKTHPVPVPQIQLEAQYPSPTLGWLGGPGTTLALRALVHGPWRLLQRVGSAHAGEQGPLPHHGARPVLRR